MGVVVVEGVTGGAQWDDPGHTLDVFPSDQSPPRLPYNPTHAGASDTRGYTREGSRRYEEERGGQEGGREKGEGRRLGGVTPGPDHGTV